VLLVACSDPDDSPDVEPARADSADGAGTDRDLLKEAPDHPIGSDGFSRHVYSEMQGQVVPSLIEGPAQQVRCQDEALPCSYLDLKALYESGAEIPEQLHITRKELGALVAQLDVVSATLARYKTINDACAAGFLPGDQQKANMGLHMIKPGPPGEFDPADPKLVLFAKAGGELYSPERLGRCVDGRWEGDQDFQIVGAAYMVSMADEHPKGFVGPFDNWHTHMNACVDRNYMAIREHMGSKGDCEAAGGIYFDQAPWMVHVYAVPEFDSQSGVFAMHNESIWPKVSAETLRKRSESSEHHH
jgi:hypothetical protein